MRESRGRLVAVLALSALPLAARAGPLEPVAANGPALAANVRHVLQALDQLGSALSASEAAALHEAIKARDAKRLQELLDPHVLVVVSLNPESRVKAARGPAAAVLRQDAFTPVLVKVHNDSTVTMPLGIVSPQAGGGDNDQRRFLDVKMNTQKPMAARLSGRKVEYAIALIRSREAGKREATLSFDVGQGSQDLGFRAEVPILFTVRPKD
jgi:hypothetical protein